MFVSATLNKAEQNYAQIQKEALALVFAVNRFHKFLCGRKFTLVTDHQPLKAIFGEKNSLPTLASSRMQRWAVILSAHQYTIKYRKSEDIAAADFLSRFPEKQSSTETVLAILEQPKLPITAQNIAVETERDLILKRVKNFTKIGWSNKCADEEIKPYFLKRHELSLEHNCLYWGSKIVIPKALTDYVLELLHEGHPGIVRMKMRARNDVWWPSMNVEIEREVGKCHVCQTLAPKQPEKNLMSWPKFEKPWYRVHIDFFYFKNTNFLLIVDSSSKWVDIHIMNGTNATQTIEKLRITFAILGLPKYLVADNGPPFNSVSLSEFCLQNGITLLYSPIYHPQSNGQAERLVRTVKEGFKKLLMKEKFLDKSLQYLVSVFLINFRNTPSSVTNRTPSESILKYTPRTLITMLKESSKGKEEDKGLDNKNREVLAEGEKVYVYKTRKKIGVKEK